MKIDYKKLLEIKIQFVWLVEQKYFSFLVCTRFFYYPTSGLADEECLERTRSIVPSETFAVSIPHFQTMFLFAVLVLEVVGFSGVPVAVSDRLARRHPEELALFALIGTGSPKVLVAHAEGLNVVLKVALLLGGVETGQVHAVEAAILFGLVPIGL